MDRSCKLESVVLEGNWLLIALSEYFKCIYKQKLKRVSTYFICFNNLNGTEPTVIYFVHIPFSMQKGRFLSLSPSLNTGGVISV